MPKSSNQKVKILYIEKILREHSDEDHPVSTARIIKHLEEYNITAERKSVYDDIEALRNFGMDIIRTPGKNGGYFLGTREFQMPELKLLVDAVQSSKFITKNKSNALIKKIESLAGAEQAKYLHRQVFVLNRVKSMNEGGYYSVDNIYNAISQDKMISFEYVSLNVMKERVPRKNGELYKVSPWSLTWDDSNYYLVAFDSDAGIIKHYRVDKMQKISIIDKPREGREYFEKFDVAIYSKQVFGMYGGKPQTVLLHCDNSLAGVIIDRFGTDVTMIPDSDCFNVSVTVIVSPPFISWCLEFGDKLRVISPSEVIDEILSVCRGAFEFYK